MSEPVRVYCPTCHTSYTADRLGVALPTEKDASVSLTMECPVCRVHFDATITHRRSWIGWFTGYDVTSHVR